MLPSYHQKRNMAMDSMRLGGGRCPPVVVLLLFLACFLLTFNWWTLSTENEVLLNQVDQLQQKLRTSSDERNQFSTLYKNYEAEVGSLRLRIQKQNEVSKQNDELTNHLTICKGELDSLTKLDVTKTATLEAQRLEKDRLNSLLDTKREETMKFIAELNKTKADMEQLKLSCNKPTVQEKENEFLKKDIENLANAGEEDGKNAPENKVINITGVKIEEQTTQKSEEPVFFN